MDYEFFSNSPAPYRANLAAVVSVAHWVPTTERSVIAETSVQSPGPLRPSMPGRRLRDGRQSSHEAARNWACTGVEQRVGCPDGE